MTGSHRGRTRWWARIIELWTSALAIAGLVTLFSIPFVHLPTAWLILSIYVIGGFAATVFRLVPLPMS